MNLDELRSVQETERRQSNLQDLRDSFYEEAGTYVADLKAERQRVADRADDPFSNPEVGRLTDEIETAEEVVEAIYERRMGKLLDEASLAAADMGTDEEGLTAEERDLFHAIVGSIEANKASVLETISGDVDDGDGASDSGTGVPGADTGTATPAPEGGADGRTPAPGVDSGDGTTPSEADPEPAPGAGRGTGRDDEDRSTPDEPDGSSGERRRVEPDSPPPDGGAPGATDDVSAAGAMGSGSVEDAGPAGTDPDAGPAGTDPDAGPPDPDGETADGSPEPPAPDEFADGDPDDATGDGTDDGGPTLDEIDDRVTVRITDDVGAIYGVDDREYDLERETVVDLPERNAEPLLDSGAAERLE